uniref:DUF4206 domain-containing protein n=1 Tax=Heterorhabditis bacteriophora TaxID=37862 RepID=A0A1I7WKE4_HETBA
MTISKRMIDIGTPLATYQQMSTKLDSIQQGIEKLLQILGGVTSTCIFCDRDNHKSDSCRMSVEKRYQLLGEKSLCSRCLTSYSDPTHTIPCRAVCEECKQGHHKLLHPTVPKDRPSESETRTFFSTSQAALALAHYPLCSYQKLFGPSPYRLIDVTPRHRASLFLLFIFIYSFFLVLGVSCTADTFYFLLLFNPILFCLIEPNICYSLYVIQSLCSYCKRGRSLPTSLSPVSSNKGI